MTSDQAERWVIVSAAVVAGVYAYRRVTETGTTKPATVKGVAGLTKPPVALAPFVTAWGFTFLMVSLLATAAPQLGGAFAILIATGDFLTNGTAVFADVAKHATAAGKGSGVGQGTTGAGTVKPAATSPAAQGSSPVLSSVASGIATVGGDTASTPGGQVAGVIGGVL